MIQEVIQAFVLIFIAEMGDKTQILAMAFATKYPVKKVLLGIMIGSFLNHGLAVLLGSQLTKVVPMNTIQLVAGVAFIGFGIWSLSIEEDDEEEEVRGKYGPVFTVALAFFIGELGDKTQLTAITLAASAKYSLLILLGTVLGMVATGGLGIFVGKKLGDKVPEFAIKVAASVIFLFFGTLKIINSISMIYLKPLYIASYVVILLLVFAILVRKNYGIYKSGETKYVHASKELHDYYEMLEKKLDRLCIGEDVCGSCDGVNCPVGNTKAILKEKEDSSFSESYDYISAKDKIFEQKIISEIIENTSEVKEDISDEDKKKLEQILNNMNYIDQEKKNDDK